MKLTAKLDAVFLMNISDLRSKRKLKKVSINGHLFTSDTVVCFFDFLQ